MDKKEKEECSEIFMAALDSRRVIDEKQHRDDHSWVKSNRIKEEKMAEFWEAMRLHLIKWGIIGSITWVAYAVWYYFKHMVNGGGNMQ